jgi:dipeptidyl aminopeptidase/acylaminoacyl peptidase
MSAALENRPPFAARPLAADVLRGLAEPDEPLVQLNPSGEWVAVFAGSRRLSAAEAAAGEPPVCGTRIDRRSFSRVKRRVFTRLSLFHAPSRRAIAVRDVHARWLEPVGFSKDGTQLAVLAVFDDAVRVAIVRPDCAVPTLVTTVKVNATLEGPVSWCGDGGHLLCRLVPDREPHVRPFAAEVYETGVARPITWHDAAPLDASDYLVSELALLDPSTGQCDRVAAPGLYREVVPSPDGRMAIVTSLEPGPRPVMLDRLPASVQIWRLTRDDGPAAVPEHCSAVVAPLDRDGAARWLWHPHRPATLVRVDPSGASRDVAVMDYPFAAPTGVLVTSDAPIVACAWTSSGRLMTTERRGEGEQLVVRCPGDVPDVLWSLPRRRVEPSSAQDEAAAVEELWPLWSAGHSGGLVFEHGGAVYLRGMITQGSHCQPFLDRVDLDTGSRRRVFASDEARFEAVVALLGDSATLALIADEDGVTAPGHRLQDLITGQRLPVGRRVTPSGDVSRRVRRPISYRTTRHGQLSAVLDWPHGAPRDVSPPCVVWVFPEVAGAPRQGREYWNRYAAPGQMSATFLRSHGYAVVNRPGLPVLTGADDCGVAEQLVEVASSLVDALVGEGVDRQRIAVAGHSLGAYAAALLLARSDLFCAGMVCSGFYDLISMPTGSPLTAQRPLWNALADYVGASPICYANHIRRPLLITCAEVDRHESVDYAAESLRLYASVVAVEGSARCVRIEHANHNYETVDVRQQLFSEILAWCDRHVRRPAGAGAEPATAVSVETA